MMKTAREIIKQIEEIPDDITYDTYEIALLEQKFYSEEEIRKLIFKMKHDCNNCFTGLTRDSDFEQAFGTMCNIVFDYFDKLLGDNKFIGVDYANGKDKTFIKGDDE